ncbi:hypothetical protein LPJ63_001609 [Coemansia sp. RSA 2711]|nr:hypothetical protein LPJ63_001609 [Coemansia sp. RSA 2711]
MTGAPDASPSSQTRQQRPQSELLHTVRRIAHQPYSALLLSAANLFALSKAKRGIRGYPTVISCTGYAGIFAASAYALSSGDDVNGSGLVFVWSSAWLFFNARKAIRSKKLAPISMTGLIAATGSIYGYHYFTIGQA